MKYIVKYLYIAINTYIKATENIITYYIHYTIYNKKRTH